MDKKQLTPEQISDKYYKGFDEVARALGIRSRDTLTKLWDNGDIKGMKVFRRIWILKSSVSDYLERLEKEALINN